MYLINFPLLSDTISFRSQDVKTSAGLEDGIVSVRLDKETGEGAGSLLLEFDASSWQLRRWGDHRCTGNNNNRDPAESCLWGKAGQSFVRRAVISELEKI